MYLGAVPAQGLAQACSDESGGSGDQYSERSELREVREVYEMLQARAPV